MKIKQSLQNLLFIARKELKYLLHERAVLIWMFIMPVVFFYFIGETTNNILNYNKHQDEIHLAIFTQEPNDFLIQQLLNQLKKDNFTFKIYEKKTKQFLTETRQLLIPLNFSQNLNSKRQQRLEWKDDSHSPFKKIERLRLKKSLYIFLANYLTLQKNNKKISADAIKQLNQKNPNLSLKVQSILSYESVPSGFEQVIPGLMIMFILMIMLSSGASLLVIERNQGLLRRLASTPISRLEIVGGKWLGKMSIGFIQIILGLLLGYWFFKMDWGESLGMIIIILLCWSAFCAALALWLGNWSHSSAQVSTLGIMITMLLSALGGCWWPIEITPTWMQLLQKTLPSGWAMDAMHRLLSFKQNYTAVLGHIALLLIATGLFLGITIRKFRYLK